MPQDVLTSAALTPFISSEKMLTAIDDAFGMKKGAGYPGAGSEDCSALPIYGATRQRDSA